VRPGVFSCGKFGSGLFSFAVIGQALARNHSRDRHGSIFDGAEWDGLWQGPARCVQAWRCRARLGRFNYENRSRGRHGCVFEGAERDVPSSVRVLLGGVCSVWSRQYDHSLGQRACGCERRGVACNVARHVRLVPVGLVLVMACCVSETTIVRARGPIDAAVVGCVWWRQACSGLACRCEFCCVKVGLVMACINHTRAGTVPDRRGRCGMNFGLACRDAAMSVEVGSGAFG